jgi:hypothetical protein
MVNEAPGRRRAEAPEGRKKGYVLMRAILDYGMGAIIFGAGIFFLVGPWLGFNYFGDDRFYRYGFSGLCLLYGGWRIYRGYKKNYF